MNYTEEERRGLHAKASHCENIIFASFLNPGIRGRCAWQHLGIVCVLSSGRHLTLQALPEAPGHSGCLLRADPAHADGLPLVRQPLALWRGPLSPGGVSILPQHVLQSLLHDLHWPGLSLGPGPTA